MCVFGFIPPQGLTGSAEQAKSVSKSTVYTSAYNTKRTTLRKDFPRTLTAYQESLLHRSSRDVGFAKAKQSWPFLSDAVKDQLTQPESSATGQPSTGGTKSSLSADFQGMDLDK